MMNLKFDRNELSGAFGDIGTDLPLLVGLTLASGLGASNVFFMFGLMQILSGAFYGLPMPVQPLKAVAIIAISQKLSGDIILGAGIAIGVIMLFLTLTGLINWISKVIPNNVIRGIQFGLGVNLVLLAVNRYVPADGLNGYILSIISCLIVIVLFGNRKLPPALPVILLGFVYAFFFQVEPLSIIQSFGFELPSVHIPNFQNVVIGFMILALPQLPLSLTNSILATQKVSEDLFPERKLKVKAISYTYSFMNIINPFFGGVPVCHGSGGLMGHYTFGARTGGSVVIYGVLYLIIGLFFSQRFDDVVRIFPLPILGVILVFEGLALAKLIKKTSTRNDLFIALLVGFIAIGLNYGYLIGLILGTILHYALNTWVNKT